MRNDGQKIIDAILARWDVDKWIVCIPITNGHLLGQACYGKGYIKINQSIIDDDDWLDTLLHEIAHIIGYHLTRRSGHGENFRFICEILYCNADSQADTEIDYVGKYTVECPCYTRQKDRMSTTRYNQYKKGIFRCGRCKETLTVIQNR